jgi:hypothetical protein
LLLVAGWLVQAGIRLLLVHAQAVPAAFPDETGYLLAARWLAGGPGGDLSGSTFYQGGYPLVLVPAFWLSHDPQVCYRLVLGINALAGAAVFPLGYLALRRFGVTRPHAYALAFAAALFPAALVFDAFALTDAVLPAVVLAWLLTLHVFLRSATPRTAALAGSAASLAAAYAYATRSRGTVILAVHLGVMGAMLIRGGFRRRTAVLPLAVAAGATGVGWALNAALRAALYPEGTLDLGGILWSRLTSADGLAWTVFGAAGQIWYLIVSTWGLAGLGLATTVTTLVRRRTSRVPRIMAGVLLSVTFGIALASSAALPDEHRVGNFVYGRYLASLAVTYALAGLATLVRRRSVFAHAAVGVAMLAGTGIAAAAHAGDRLGDYQFIAFDFPETSFLTGDWTSLRLGTASLAATGLLALLCVMALGPRPALAIAVCLTGFNLLADLTIDKPWGPVRTPIFHAGSPTGGVAVDPGVGWRVRVRQAYQVWWTPLTFFDQSRGAPPTGICLFIVPRPEGAAPDASWSRHPAGWQVVTSGTGATPWVAWQRTDCHKTAI